MLFSPRVIGLTLFSCLLVLALSLRAMPEEDSLSLAVYHKGERAANLPAVFPQARPFTLLLHARQTLPSDASALACANLFAAVDKLTGLQYYSHSEKKMTTLFMESVVLEHPRARASTNAPSFRKLPLDTTFYVRQVDNRIGEVVYRATLFADSASATLFLYNVSPGVKFNFQLVESGDFLLYLAARRTAAGELEFEAWQWQRFKDGLLGIFIKEASFVNRLKAVAGFYQQALRTK